MGKDEAIALGKALWSVANKLRGSMDASDFRDYILAFIFFKYLSENYYATAKEILKEDVFASWDKHNDHDREKIGKHLKKAVGYFIDPNHLWVAFAQKATQKQDIIGALKEALIKIEDCTIGHSGEDDLKGLFSDLDLNSPKLGQNYKDKNLLICQVIKTLDDELSTNNTSRDDLGDAYEYLIAQFATNAGKKAGEFYTPQKISTLLSLLVIQDPNTKTQKTRLKSIYDPTCGSGSLLFNVYKQIGRGNTGRIYGQEKNITAYNLARMNLFLHQLKHEEFDIRHGDTLSQPWFTEPQQFEAIVANPPYSLNWDPDSLAQDSRFRGYGVPPKDKADLAFVLHMIYHLADNGTCAVLVPHGVLFRGNAEGQIRKALLTAGPEKKGYLDAVIGLPGNLFFSTGIPVCILIFRKCRMQDEILFIEASKHFEKITNQNIITDEHIEQIIHTFIHRKETDKFSRNVSLKEIEENDYNLNIPRYVDTQEDEVILDTQEIVKNMKNLDKQISENEQHLEALCQQLGVDIWK